MLRSTWSYLGRVRVPARRGDYIDFGEFPDGLGGAVHVRVSTRWEEVGVGHPVPPELWPELRKLGHRVGASTSAGS